MPDAPDRAAREVTAEVLRKRAYRLRQDAVFWRRQYALRTNDEYAGHVKMLATRATQLEAVAAWLEGQDG